MLLNCAEFLKVNQFFATTKDYFYLVLIVLFWFSFLGCNESEDEIVFIASSFFKLEPNASLNNDQMVLKIALKSDFKSDFLKIEKKTNGKNLLIKHTEDSKKRLESDINPGYLNLDRFEDSLAYKNKAALEARPIIGPIERLHAADKKFIFGGDGFDTRDFEKLNDEKLIWDFSSFLNPQSEKMLEFPLKSITNLNKKLIPEEKNLIFHNTSSALTKTEVKFFLNHGTKIIDKINLKK